MGRAASCTKISNARDLVKYWLRQHAGMAICVRVARRRYQVVTMRALAEFVDVLVPHPAEM
jgi:hypothetical protein